MKTIALSCILAFSVVLVSSTVIADGFYVIPVKGQVTSWDKKISGTSRFKLVLDDEAVLDRETGLVWEQSAIPTAKSWTDAILECYRNVDGGRRGWRLPTVEELMTLSDPTQQDPALPPEHPFNVVSAWYWTSTTDASDSSKAYRVGIGGGNTASYVKTTEMLFWCVRGGYGHDAY